MVPLATKFSQKPTLFLSFIFQAGPGSVTTFLVFFLGHSSQDGFISLLPDPHASLSR